MPERYRTVVGAFGWALAPAAGCVIGVLGGSLGETLIAAGAFVGAHLITLPNSAGRRLSLSAMMAVAAWLLTDSSLVVIGGAAIGLPIGLVLIRLRLGPKAVTNLFPAESVALAAAVGVLWAGRLAIGSIDEKGEVGHLILVTLAAGAWYLVAAFVRVVLPIRPRRVFRRMVWWEALADGPAYLALVSAGALFGLTYPVLGWWSVPLAGLPYAFSHLALDRLAQTRRTYRQTIMALGRIPEAGGYVEEGHARRTAELARSIGAEMGFGPFRVQRVGYAALLHDVGRVVLNDPSIAEYTQRDLAQWSAAIISESASLESVATIVARHKDPYRRPGEERDPDLPREAQVVQVAATFDRSVVRNEVGPPEALELLHRGAAYDYDPEVVAALRRVLQRRAVEGV